MSNLEYLVIFTVDMQILLNLKYLYFEYIREFIQCIRKPLKKRNQVNLSLYRLPLFILLLIFLIDSKR